MCLSGSRRTRIAAGRSCCRRTGRRFTLAPRGRSLHRGRLDSREAAFSILEAARGRTPPSPPRGGVCFTGRLPLDGAGAGISTTAPAGGPPVLVLLRERKGILPVRLALSGRLDAGGPPADPARAVGTPATPSRVRLRDPLG